jgi:hypothetical protein
MITGAFLSIILCSLTFLRVRGNLLREGWKLSVRRTSGKAFEADPTKHAAQQILS